MKNDIILRVIAKLIMPFMVLFAAFQLLLYRTTGRSDVAAGSPITNRDREAFEKLIGFFANTVVLRSQIAAGAS